MSPYRPHEVEAAGLDDLEGVAVALVDGTVEVAPGPQADAGQRRIEDDGRLGASLGCSLARCLSTRKQSGSTILW